MVKVSIEEAVEARKLGMTEEEFKQILEKKKDEKFTELHWHIVFKEQRLPDGTVKKLSFTENGKVIFPDRHENLEEIKVGYPYICLVYDSPEHNAAFCRIISEEYIPTIFVSPTEVVSAVWRDKQGELHREPLGLTKEEIKISPSPFQKRLLKAITILEENTKAPQIMIIFRKNQFQQGDR